MRVRSELTGPDRAPVLLLSNSLGTDSGLWDRVVPLLADRVRVLRYDTRGHGRTPAPPGPYALDELVGDVVELLDEHRLDRVSVCGVSLGGMTAMRLATVAPERVDRLVLACTSAHLPPRSAWEERAATVRTAGVGAIADAVLARWFTPGFAEREPSAYAALAAQLDGTDREGYAGCCEAISVMDQREAIGAITAPTLVIAGAEDPATPVEHAEVLVDRIAGARLVVLPDAAHLANVEQPSAFAAAVLAHVDDSRDRTEPDRTEPGRTEPGRTEPGRTTYDDGLRVRREVLGDAHVDRSLARRTPLTEDFQDFLTRYAWGEVWTRPGLDRRTRSCITVAMLVALGRDEELAMHLRAARRNGVTAEELAEVLLHSALYCGLPAANQAFAELARQVEADGT